MQAAQDKGQGKLFLIGWDEISNATGMKEKVLKRLVRDEGFPVVHIGQRPVSSRGLLAAWLVQRVRLQAQGEKKDAEQAQNDE